MALVSGVVEHRVEIDRVLAALSGADWPLERMPAVDRNILRIAAFEVLFNDDVPDEVAVSEAVGLARDLSTDESPTFVNGLLAALARAKPTLSGGASVDNVPAVARVRSERKGNHEFLGLFGRPA